MKKQTNQNQYETHPSDFRRRHQLFPYRDLNALNTVGYRELFDYFDGKCTLEQAVTDIKTHTRRYAKRQITWFKREYEEILIHNS